MVREGVEAFENSRRRYDGERRNPWDEAECGHHYARAMSAWSGVLALSGFRYHAAEKSVTIMPRVDMGAARFQSFWSSASAWGTFTHAVDAGSRRVTIAVTEGSLRLRSIVMVPWPSAGASATLQGRAIPLRRAGLAYPTRDQAPSRDREGAVFTFTEDLTIHAGEELVLNA